jgi:hypothetical protein
VARKFFGENLRSSRRKKKERKRKKKRPVEADARWKPWKNQRAQAIFPPFAPRLENSPQKSAPSFPPAPTGPAAAIGLKKFELKNG